VGVCYGWPHKASQGHTGKSSFLSERRSKAGVNKGPRATSTTAPDSEQVSGRAALTTIIGDDRGSTGQTKVVQEWTFFVGKSCTGGMGNPSDKPCTLRPADDPATPTSLSRATTPKVATTNTPQYPTPPSSDEPHPTPTRDTPTPTPTPPSAPSPAPSTAPSLMPPRPNYYPDSAFGPNGPEAPGYGVQAAYDTASLAAAGYFTPRTPAPSTSRSSRSPPSEYSRAGSVQPHGGSSGPVFFSSPPIPVFHHQPQDIMSYYPGARRQANNFQQQILTGPTTAPHHQALLLEQHKSRQQGRPPNVDPALFQGGHAGPRGPPPRPPPGVHPGAQIMQGGVIYTPDSNDLGLHSLSDGPPGEKPPYPYPTIIRCAILGSPRQRLTLSEIYIAMENRYPWFKTAGQGWKVTFHPFDTCLFGTD
jgi:hypothetical protein